MPGGGVLSRDFGRGETGGLCFRKMRAERADVPAGSLALCKAAAKAWGSWMSTTQLLYLDVSGSVVLVFALRLLGINLA